MEPDSAEYLDSVGKKMTPAQIAEAQKLARQWKPKQSGDRQGRYKGAQCARDDSAGQPGAYTLRAFFAVLLVIVTFQSWATEATITDGDTLLLGGKPYRLDGIDAPETDQICLDEKGSLWACGIEARDQLKQFVGKREVRCDGTKFDTLYRNRRIAVCWVEGETVSLNQWLVRGGWAVNFEPYAKKRFKNDEDDARQNSRGLWKGCFAPPQSARRGSKSTAPLLGAGCGKDETKVRDLLFPADPAMPSGCAIKGKLAVRANVTGHRGIYHLEGCRSYSRAKRPDRWFCSEEEAQAEGFRKAFTC